MSGDTDIKNALLKMLLKAGYISKDEYLKAIEYVIKEAKSA